MLVKRDLTSIGFEKPQKMINKNSTKNKKEKKTTAEKLMPNEEFDIKRQQRKPQMYVDVVVARCHCRCPTTLAAATTTLPTPANIRRKCCCYNGRYISWGFLFLFWFLGHKTKTNVFFLLLKTKYDMTHGYACAKDRHSPKTLHTREVVKTSPHTCFSSWVGR